MIGNLYFPPGERHFQTFADDVENYQRPQREKAFEYVTNWRCAVDIGANVGIFARHFAHKFERVVAIEPIPVNVACIQLNTPDNVEIVEKAIGDRSGACEMYLTDKSLGGAFVSDHDGVDRPPMKAWRDESRSRVEMVRLDDLALEDVGLIKLDIQGSEVIALKGARETLERCRPVVLIEEKPLGGPTGSTLHIEMAAEVLIDYGMVPKERVGADRIYVFE
jgi:FkbM family methyltransferase